MNENAAIFRGVDVFFIPIADAKES